MNLPSIASAMPDSPDRAMAMMAKSHELEAAFLAEMLAHSGLGEMKGPFGGGEGEEQFTSFLRQEQARLMVEKGGIGLSELIFLSMAGGADDDHA